jgi:hypothetical protein
MEDNSGTGTDPFSDLTSLRIPQEQLQTDFAAKTHPSNPRALPIRTKSIGGPILVDWLVAAAKQGKDALLDPMIAEPEGGPSSDMQRFED